ncbi:MAG: exosortase F system-associated protein [Nonlabens sp.]
MKSRTLTIFGVIILVVALILVRVFERYIFDTTLIDYFHGAFELKPIPDGNFLSIYLSISLRFLINSTISVAILYLIYSRKFYLNASLWVYFISFIVLSIAFLILIQGEGEFVKRALFYVRRFLIHPLLLFILAAGFYFMDRNTQR